MTWLSISSCPAALLCFTDLKVFSNSSEVRSLYSIFFCTGNRKSSNVLDVFCILLGRFGPTFVKYLSNSSKMRLFFFIDFPLTFIDLGNLLELTLHIPVIYFIIGFDVKSSFASRPVSRLIRWYKKPGDITKEFWEKAIQFRKLSWLATTFLRDHLNSKEVSYLPWQNMYPKLKTTSHIKLFFSCELSS